jgi:hypothetical protein
MDESATAYLRTLAGANKIASTITAFRTDPSQFAHFLTETDCAISSPAYVTHDGVTDNLAHPAGQGASGTTWSSWLHSGSSSASEVPRTRSPRT